MDLSGVPVPPAHYTEEQKERFLLDYIKKAMSVSTTKDGSVTPASKDEPPAVDQPLTTTEDPELPLHLACQHLMTWVNKALGIENS